FDVAEHVVALAEPGQVMTRARFDELCDAVLSLPLARGRALWSLHVAPQLEDGSLGLVMKAHHAMVDGKSAVELALLLLDLSPQRMLGHDTHEIVPLIAAKTALGVTLNDLALTAVSGALRELAMRAGERPESLKAMVPVSTRAPEQAADLGNQISFVFVDLP